MIDWQFFFLAWELKGKYPAILRPAGRPRALRRRERAARPDHRRRAACTPAAGTGSGPRTPRATTSWWTSGRRAAPADAAPADRQAGGPARTGASPTTSRRPGSPRRVRGRHPRRRRAGRGSTRPSSDDYRAIMVKALADRLAEAFAEHIAPAGPPRLVRAGRRLRRSRTCTPNGSGASGPRSATRPAPTIASSGSSSTCSAPATRHGAHRIVRDDARAPACQRAALRPPRVPLLHRRPHRAGPGRGLRPPPRYRAQARSSAGCGLTSPTNRMATMGWRPGGRPARGVAGPGSAG